MLAQYIYGSICAFGYSVCEPNMFRQVFVHLGVVLDFLKTNTYCAVPHHSFPVIMKAGCAMIFGDKISKMKVTNESNELSGRIYSSLVYKNLQLGLFT